MAKKLGLYNKRYKTLKEHRAAVAARKALQGGKNRGPVANADAYGETLKKPKAKAKPAATKPAKAKPAKAKPATPVTDRRKPAHLQLPVDGKKPAKTPATKPPKKTETKKKRLSGPARQRALRAAANKRRSEARKKAGEYRTRTRYQRGPGGRGKRIEEIYVNGKWKKAGGKG